MMLPSVEEWSVDESGADARPSTKVNQSSLAAKEKIDAIMKRGSKNEPKPNAADPSFHEDDVSKVHLIASKYRHAEEDDSLSTPQTTPGELEDDMRQYIANNNEQRVRKEGSFHSTGDSHGVYST